MSTCSFLHKFSFWVGYQTISIIFAVISFGIASIYYALTLRRAAKDRQTTLETRQAQLFMQIRDKWDMT